MFVQNAEVGYQLTSPNSEIWIENSYVGAGWNIHHQTIITGVPAHNWNLEVPSGVCKMCIRDSHRTVLNLQYKSVWTVR